MSSNTQPQANAQPQAIPPPVLAVIVTMNLLLVLVCILILAWKRIDSHQDSSLCAAASDRSTIGTITEQLPVYELPPCYSNHTVPMQQSNPQYISVMISVHTSATQPSPTPSGLTLSSPDDTHHTNNAVANDQPPTYHTLCLA
ncbi:hypothetical protein BASA50_002365 [Batrachochytrium salamandrivorans]|uniref:Brl1/Brr6 domain-containing protein n=1 Tax=Batrachochytrium salamandrivorans TaxID=1357716 RepID=A0ABQ8FLH5_9FUNG|nr:hypothetical protein BASA60_010755 [Batrachochytrium salamandrivorans]KAH6569602.1 hypothetical protein BASA62_004768 [Batrachochytrium salamandrivorans]KAH6580048.1 hypothetical protein BASA61_009860 [Batrachochytrium salamandrivorans]KAH6600354.1 hypothetical protein BASA50_002365 [Batrachochytrium salamandrivorans]KAH9268845.1 hypothetical protein BASA83_009133 [Batrachochytrium salamandrivorans]